MRRRPEYTCWKAMLQRCANPRASGFVNYGGRGIRVDPRWEASFEAFLADVGPRPSPAHSLDRRDNDGHYEPGNVRWATRGEQANNRRRSGRMQEWARRHPETWEAKRVLYRTIKAGQIVVPERCEDCGAPTRVVSYHPDPQQLLRVIWLCSWCRYRVWCLANGKPVPEQRVRRLPESRARRVTPRIPCAGHCAGNAPCPWRGRHRWRDLYYCAMHLRQVLKQAHLIRLP